MNRRLALIPVLLAAAVLALFQHAGRALLSPVPAAAASIATATPPSLASPHVALGVPVDADPSDDHLIVRPQYVVSYNPRRNGPNWSAWKLVASDFGGTRRHKGHFLPDDTLPASFYQVIHDDYTGSGYDRGHLVRSEDRTRSDADNASTFIMTNVLPQRHALNGGPWLRLEDRCRALAVGEGRELYIVAGGLYGAMPATIGHGVQVPEAFYKVVVVLGPGQGAGDAGPDTRVISVVMPNAEGIEARPWTTYRVPLAEVERRSGYTLLGRVAGPVRATLRTRTDEGP